MLLNFRFQNFKSFNDLTEFSMISGKVRQHPKNLIKSEKVNLLKFSSIYGANAGGKSSFVEAIKLSKNIILGNLKELMTHELYNKNHTENEGKSSDFEFEIMVEDKIYSYGVSVILNSKKIVKEYLIDITGEEELIFGRNDNNIELNPTFTESFNEVDSLRLRVYSADLKDSETLLSVLNSRKNKFKDRQNNAPITEKVFLWFKNTLEVIGPTESTSSLHLSYLNAEYLKKLGDILGEFDTGVKAVTFEKISVQQMDIPATLRERLFEDIRSRVNSKESVQNRGAILQSDTNIYNIDMSNAEPEIYEIRFKHKLGDSTYSFQEQSDGTQRIINIVSVLLNDEDKVYVIDELDRSLHPNLSYNFVDRFLKQKTKSQLVVTTHEDVLLDLNLLRRDQIWFIDKNDNLDSEIYPLEAFKDRFDKDILKAYLQGRYGSVPKLTKIFDSLENGDQNE